MTINSFVDQAGFRLAYTRQRSGPVVLLIQGVGVHGDGWLPQVEALGGQFTCITFDNRGLGQSGPAVGPISVEQIADDARAVLDAEKIDACHVVGHSLGGTVAIPLALQARERVRSLALLCTFADGRDAAPLTPRMMWMGMRSRIGTRAMRRRGFAGLIFPPGRAVNADFPRLAALFGHDLADTPKVVGLQFKAMRRAALSGRLGELDELPMVVASAVHDPIARRCLGKSWRRGSRGRGMWNFLMRRMVCRLRMRAKPMRCCWSICWGASDSRQGDLEFNSIVRQRKARVPRSR